MSAGSVLIENAIDGSLLLLVPGGQFLAGEDKFRVELRVSCGQDSHTLTHYPFTPYQVSSRIARCRANVFGQIPAVRLAMESMDFATR